MIGFVLLQATGVSMVPKSKTSQSGAAGEGGEEDRKDSDSPQEATEEQLEELQRSTQDVASGALEADEDEGGKVYFFRVSQCKRTPGMTPADAAYHASICPGRSVISLAWSKALNQIAVSVWAESLLAVSS